MSAISGFALLGLIHFAIIGSRYDYAAVKYLFVTLDFAILSALIATQPLYETVDLPQVLIFRNAIFPFYFIILGMAAFSLSPKLVIWAGFAGVFGWLGAFGWSIRGMTEMLGWGDIGPKPSNEKFMEIFFNPNFIGFGSRIQESFAFLIVALLIAVVIWRARKTVLRQLELDEQRRTISEVFAQYVPKKIADTLIADRGLLAPVAREATVLFIDIANFTAMTEKVGPQRTVAILNAFFERTTTCITDNNGVVTQFIGDAVMATFNLPVEDHNHQINAVNTVRQLIELVKNDTFDGMTLSIRIGLCTGPVIAGNIGGGGRQSYTVYGDTVNLASRLESLNKEHNTQVLISQTTLASLDPNGFKQVGEITVRGFSEPISVYTI